MNAFISAKVGAYVAEAIPKPELGDNPPEWAQHATLMIYKVESAEDAPDMPKVLRADEVAALAADGRLPVAIFDDNGIPTITIPDTDAPTGLAVQVLTEGTGETIKPNDKFTALYTGWTWADGQKYDSAYDRGSADPFDFRTVIEGWLVGLTGQKVGSTVQLTVPATMLFDYQAGSVSRPAGPPGVRGQDRIEGVATAERRLLRTPPHIRGMQWAANSFCPASADKLLAAHCFKSP